MYTLLATGDVPGAATYFNPLLQQTIIPCTSGTRPSSPPQGMVIYETDTDQLKIFNGSAWRRTGAFDQETYGSVFQSDSTALTSITSTSFIPGSPTVGFTFVAPASGAVSVTLSGTVRQSQNGFSTYLTYAIRTGNVVGSGTVVVAASSLRAVSCGQAVNTGGPAILSASFRHPHSGLTPGSTYNIRAEYSVSGGTGEVDYRMLQTEPVL